MEAGDRGIERLKWIGNPANKTETQLVTAIMRNVCMLIGLVKQHFN